MRVNWNQVGIADVVLGVTRAIIVFALLMASWPALTEAKGQEKTPVFVGFNQPPGPLEEGLVRSFGGEVTYTYQIVNAIAASLPPSSIDGLRYNPRVAYIESDLAVSKIDHTTTSGDAELNNTWGVKHIGSGAVHAADNRGSGIRVAVLDSGIALHPDLSPDPSCSMAFGYASYNDGDGHGTHVSGTIAALDNNVDTSVVGVAPQASVCALKVLSDTGSGSYSDVVAALDWIRIIFNPAHPGNPIRITNNSYGSSGDPGVTVKAAFDNSYAAGILHLGAAGNSGTRNGQGSNCIYPARWSSVVAVTATTSTDSRASFSSTCAEVEIAAPGANIRSTVPGGGYENWNGTSMATPHVSGTAALVLAANPGWTNLQVRERLQTTANDLGTAGRDTMYGYGLVDADEAALGSGLPPNQPPVADAGSNQTVTDTDNSGAESVTLTGSGSYDPDGAIGSYMWSESGSTIATGVNPSVLFSVGVHTVTLTVTDDDSATDIDTVVITVQAAPPPPGTVTLTATGYKVKGLQKADLSWSGATTSNVDIWRNGTKIVSTTVNDGFETDNINVRGGGSYTYEVCEAGSTTVCSNTAIVTY